jgi:hypothetical protein
LQIKEASFDTGEGEPQLRLSAGVGASFCSPAQQQHPLADILGHNARPCRLLASLLTLISRAGQVWLVTWQLSLAGLHRRYDLCRDMYDMFGALIFFTNSMEEFSRNEGRVTEDWSKVKRALSLKHAST